MADRLDLDFVQSQFPALAQPWVFFDNAGGSQILARRGREDHRVPL